MTATTKMNMTARAAAWYTAAYRRLARYEECQDGLAVECLFQPPRIGGWRTRLARRAEKLGAAYDARAAIAARYARLASEGAR